MKKRKLNVYMWGQNSGVSLYRIHQPAKFLKKSGLVNVRTSEYRWGEEQDKIAFPSLDELNKIGSWADIIVYERCDLAQVISTFCGLGEHFNIPVVMETDDNIEAVRPFNPGYRGYHPRSEATQWGKLAPKMADAITVTTDNLQQWHKERSGKTPYVLPNSIDFTRFGDRVEKKKHKKVHLGWIVSGAHYENYQIIDKPVLEIMKKHKNVILWTMSMYNRAIWYKDIPEDIKKRIRRIDWGKTKDWPKTLAKCSLDISLCPLMDNMFNRAKSNLRYLENATNRTACIVSPVEAYKCVKDGVTGLVAQEQHEWFEAIESLILDENKRLKIGDNAYKDVYRNFNQEKNVKMWVSAYEDIVKKFQESNGPRRYIQDL